MASSLRYWLCVGYRKQHSILGKFVQSLHRRTSSWCRFYWCQLCLPRWIPGWFRDSHAGSDHRCSRAHDDASSRSRPCWPGGSAEKRITNKKNNLLWCGRQADEPAAFFCVRLPRGFAPPKQQHYPWSKDVGAVPRTAQQARSGIGPYEKKAVSSIDNPGRSRGLLLAMTEERHTG